MRSVRFVATLGLALIASRARALPRVQDQSDLRLDGELPISSFLVAEDLNFASNTRIDTVTVWFSDNTANNDGIFNDFSGTLSWALYFDSSGPNGLSLHGKAANVEVVDTGFQTTSNHDVFRVRFQLDGRPNVGPGRMWLVLHEGLWGSATDGSTIHWLLSSSVYGSSAYETGNETNPGPGEWFHGEPDTAIVVEGDRQIWNQQFIDDTDCSSLSAAVSANDFNVPSGTTLYSLDAFIADLSPNNNGLLDNFGGTLSWAIYQDDAGKPGAIEVFGQDTTPSIVDTGDDLVTGGDIARVRIELASRPTLTGGTGNWWLVLHEGNWGAAYDGSSICWARYVTPFLSEAKWSDNESSPGSWQNAFESPGDLAFFLFEDEIFSSSFEAGVTCAWSVESGGADCP